MENKELLSQEKNTQALAQPMDEQQVRQWVAEALKQEKRKWQEEMQSAQQEETLPEDACARKQLEAREEALRQREAALTEREMRSFAREQLAERNLPDALLDALCCKDEESCKESLNKVEQAFRAAVQEGVLVRMRGEEPRKAHQESLDSLDDTAYYRATYAK